MNEKLIEALSIFDGKVCSLIDKIKETDITSPDYMSLVKSFDFTMEVYSRLSNTVQSIQSQKEAVEMKAEGPAEEVEV